MFSRPYDSELLRRSKCRRRSDQARRCRARSGQRVGSQVQPALSQDLSPHLGCAVQHNPGEAKGLDSALAELASQPFGPILLGIVALGLIAYGIYSFVEARYRKVG